MKTRSQYHAQLQKLKQKLDLLGNLSRKSLELACAFTKTGHAEYLDELAVNDQESMQEKNAVDHLAMTLLLREQPVAAELRYVASAMKIAQSMNRITRQAAEAAEIFDTPALPEERFTPMMEEMMQIVYVASAMKIAQSMNRITRQAAEAAEIFDTPALPEERFTPMMEEMMQIVLQMVSEANESLFVQDCHMALEVMNNDDEVDRRFETIKSQLIEGLRKEQIHPEAAVDLLMISKYLERIADHAFKIAKWSCFIQSGKTYREEELKAMLQNNRAD